jgi:hypothetical protein
MKRVSWLFLLAVPLWAVPTQAQANGCCSFSFCWPSFHIDAGISAHCSVSCGDCANGPWYMYWPYEAYFQTPAPVTPYPSWPGPMTAGAAGSYASPGAFSPTAPVPGSGWTGPPPQASFNYPGFNYPGQPQVPMQPVGYYYQQAPSYWYGR